MKVYVEFRRFLSLLGIALIASLGVGHVRGEDGAPTTSGTLSQSSGNQGKMVKALGAAADSANAGKIPLVLSGTLSTPVAHHGSLAAELGAILKQYTGKSPIAQGNAGELSGTWDESADRYGTVFFTKEISFADFYHWAEKQFGKQQLSGTPYQSGAGGSYQQYVIPARVSGGAIWFSERTDGLHITVNRPMHL